MRTLKSQRHEKKGRHFSHWLTSLSCACLSCHLILTFFFSFLFHKQQQPVLIIACFLFLQLLSLHPKPFSSQYPHLSGIMQWKPFQPASGIKHVMKTFKPLCNLSQSNLRVNIKERQHDSWYRKREVALLSSGFLYFFQLNCFDFIYFPALTPVLIFTCHSNFLFYCLLFFI